MVLTFPPNLPLRKGGYKHSANLGSRSCNIVTDYRTRSSGTRTAAEAESKPKGGCCNQRLSGLMGDVAKISFQTQSHSKHEYLHSKQQPTIDKSAEAQHADREPLSNENRADFSARLKCG